MSLAYSKHGYYNLPNTELYIIISFLFLGTMAKIGLLEINYIKITAIYCSEICI